jgi:hypothetical protein
MMTLAMIGAAGSITGAMTFMSSSTITSTTENGGSKKKILSLEQVFRLFFINFFLIINI